MLNPLINLNRVEKSDLGFVSARKQYQPNQRFTLNSLPVNPPAMYPQQFFKFI